MAYDEKLADRVREALMDHGDLEEKRMFGGVCFMLNGKMCLCVSHSELMCRVAPQVFEEALEKPGTRPMVHNGRSMKNFVYVEGEFVKAKKDFDYWVKAALEYNKIAKPSKAQKK